MHFTNPIETLDIEAIKTDAGYFIRKKISNYSYDCELQNYLFDGERGEKTHNPRYLKIKKAPKKVEVYVKQPDINHRFELIDPKLASPQIPLIMPYEDATGSADYKWDDSWVIQYAHLKSLYELKTTSVPDVLMPVPFNFNVFLELDKIVDYGGFSYPVQKTRWAHEGFIPLTQENVSHEDIDTILFPDIILPARTSSLTSEQTYKIIRKHIQDNIDPKYAKITSDYDFCFTVAKKIPLHEKVPYQRDISRLNSRKPKYVTDYRYNRDIVVFEMTYSPENYKNYTPITPFTGKNVEDLKNNIDSFLKELMEKINEPLKDCPHCKGQGVIIV